ncbi:MAG: FecR domain-containing protein, partial [Burkholderiaceae bacterium]
MAEPDASQPDALAAAAQWFAVLRDEGATADDRARWRDWLAASPRHAQAWQRVEAIGGAFAGAREAVTAPIARKTLARAETATRRRRTLRLLLVAGFSFAAVELVRRTASGPGESGLWRPWMDPIAARFAGERTGVGEVRSLRLPDGGTLVLNTATAVDVDFDAALRRIVLRAGEILVTTAPDARIPARPLVVDTAFGRLTALGTRFSVMRTDVGAALSVYAGTVRVAPAAGTPTRDVPTGRQVRFTGDAVSADEVADMAREGWAGGRLIADDIRLDR